MAQRNFWTIQNGRVAKGLVEFQWEPGMSTAQRRRSCQNMHDTLRVLTGLNPMDISSASTTKLGVNLSAFNLRCKGRTVECLYQGSKVYEDGKSMQYLYDADSLTAKKSMKTYHGRLVGFKLFDTEYPTEPRTLFYDFLYINALVSSYGTEYQFEANCWTDVQAKLDVDACQARAVCEYVLLQQENVFNVLTDIKLFEEWHRSHVECEYEGYNYACVRYADGGKIFCYPHYEPTLRKTFMFTGKSLIKESRVEYTVKKRDPLHFGSEWCVVYSDIFLDDLCALQYLSYFYENLYLVTVRENDIKGNPYCSDRVQDLESLLSVTGQWFEKVLLSKSVISDFEDDVHVCDCFVMANATKVTCDLKAGITFRNISGMIGSATPETEWNASQDLNSYHELMTYGIRQYSKEFCESCADYPDRRIDFLEEYITKMQAMNENTCCYDLQMVRAAIKDIHA